jgi:Holliday junction resolvase RusA-like endonuclease
MAVEVVDLTQEANQELRMYIPICPVAKPSVSYGPGRGRGRGSQGWFRAYINNDVRNKMNQFKSIVQEFATASGFSIIPRHIPVQLKVWFFLRRPDTDFVGRNRSRGHTVLQEEARADNGTIVAIKPDTDNMGKFVLDGLTGVIYEDDCQVVDLHMFKLRDSSGTCDGRIAIDAKVCRSTTVQMLPNF